MDLVHEIIFALAEAVGPMIVVSGHLNAGRGSTLASANHSSVCCGSPNLAFIHRQLPALCVQKRGGDLPMIRI